MRESINEISINETLINIIRDKTLQVTGIDVFRKYSYKTQVAVDGRTCFIGCLILFISKENFSNNVSLIGRYIHINRATVYVCKRNIETKKDISNEIINNIAEIKKMVSVELLKTFVAPTQTIMSSIENRLIDYINYLISEQEKTSKLLQIIKG